MEETMQAKAFILNKFKEMGGSENTKLLPAATETEKASIANPTPSKMLLTKNIKFHIFFSSAKKAQALNVLGF